MKSKNVVVRFRQAGLIKRVAARFAMEHSSPEELKDYLHEHPGADPKNHHVEKKDNKPSSGGDDKASKEFMRHGQNAEKKLKAISRFAEQADKQDGPKAKEALDKTHAAGSELHDLGVQLHKKLSGMKSKSADKEFGYMKGSLKKLEDALSDAKEGSMHGFSAKAIAKAADELYGDIHRVTALGVSGNL